MSCVFPATLKTRLTANVSGVFQDSAYSERVGSISSHVEDLAYSERVGCISSHVEDLAYSLLPTFHSEMGGSITAELAALTSAK